MWGVFAVVGILVLLLIASRIILPKLKSTKRDYLESDFVKLPENRPTFAFFPKYLVEFDIARDINSQSAYESRIRQSLVELSFRESKAQPLKFQRGLKYGDFSTKVAQIVVVFDPIHAGRGPFRIMYGWVCLFDTGDLWELAAEIRTKLHKA